MKQKILSVTLVGAVFFLASCTHSIHHVHTSGFSPYAPLNGGKIIQANEDKFVILGFTSDVDYVDRAYRKLMNQCPTGSVKGITTQYSTSHGFFSWTNKILLTGLCVNSG